MMVKSTISATAATASVSDKSTSIATRATTSTAPPLPPPTVCVIGGGPGALFFCHALETQKKLLLAKGEDISHFPDVVKCFERSPGPGGVWRSDRTHGDKKKSETTKNVNVNMSAMEDDDDDDDESSVIASSTVNEINSLDVSMDNNDVMDSSMSSASSVDSVEYQHHHLDLILSSPSLCPKNKKQRMLDIITDNDHDEKEAVDKTVETSTLTTATSLTASSSSLSLTSGETDEGGGGGVVAEEGGGAAAAAAAPGAIAIATTTGHEPKTNMYSALWTNGAKEAFEFYDYTFVDHFGVEVAAKLPTFLPRKLVLEYLLARCTHKCPTFFDKYFSFHTTVLNVKYVAADEDDDAQEQKQAQHKNKFQLTLQDETTGLISIEYYDKCIWAGGNEGVPSIPKTTKQLFENAKNNKCTTTTTTTTTSNSSNNNSGSSSTINSSSSSSSSGSSSSSSSSRNCSSSSSSITTNNNDNNNHSFRMVHSSDTSNFKADVEHKNVLIIGGGFSAEDLALMAIKEGVNHIYITSRRSYGVDGADGLIATRWPYDKVTVHFQTCVTEVTSHSNSNNDDTNKNSNNTAITLTKCEWCYTERKYVLWDEEDYETEGLAPIVLNNIDTVIFCTGYQPNFTMLDKTLSPYYNQATTNHEDCCQFQVPEKWSMHDEQKNNDMTIDGAGADANADADDSSSESSEEEEEGKEYDIEEYLSSLYCQLSQHYFGDNYKQIENAITPPDRVYTSAPYAEHVETLYRGTFSIQNTNMMYLVNQETDNPLLEVEVTAWMIAKVISQQAVLPHTQEEMIQENITLNLKAMKCPNVRYEVDPAYARAVNSTYHPDTDEHVNQEHIEKVSKELKEILFFGKSLLALGKYMIEYEYPVSFVNILETTRRIDDDDDHQKATVVVGTTGTAVTTSYCWSNYYHHYKKICHQEYMNSRMKLNTLHCDDETHGFWRTFRDNPQADKFVSYFTGLKSVPLSKRWFDLNEDDTLW